MPCQQLELYDLTNDPREKQNLVGHDENIVNNFILLEEIFNRNFIMLQKQDLQKNKIEIDKDLHEKLKSLGYIR